MKYREIRERMDAIELTIDCIRIKIEEIEEDFKNDLYEEEEIEDSKECLVYLNQIKNFLGSLRDEYYMWSCECMFDDFE